MKKETKQQQVTEHLNEVLKRFWIVEVSACTDKVGTQQNEIWVMPKSTVPTRAAAEKECDELAETLRGETLSMYDTGDYDCNDWMYETDEEYEDGLAAAEEEYYASGEGWWTIIKDFDTLFDAATDTIQSPSYYYQIEETDRKIINKLIQDAEDAAFDDDEEEEGE